MCQRESVMLVMEYFMSNSVFFYVSESVLCASFFMLVMEYFICLTVCFLYQ